MHRLKRQSLLARLLPLSVSDLETLISHRHRHTRRLSHYRSTGRAFVLTAALLFSASAQVDAQSLGSSRQVVPGEYLIEPALMASVSGVEGSSSVSVDSLGLEVKASLLGGSRLVIKPSVAAMSIHATPEFVAYDEADTFCKELLSLGVARSCEQNLRLSIFATPNDPRLGDLWGMSPSVGIDAPRAWDFGTGDSSVVIAVVDTGIDYTHPDLAANMWVNTGEIPGNGIDDDGNGVIDDVYGYNALNNSGNPMDDNGHGTHVAGTIGARGSNGVGVVGVNWNVKLMGLKFLGASGSGSLAGAIKALDYLVEMKRRGVNVRVANNSWGGPGFSQALHDAIKRAEQNNIIFVAAAGNASNDNDQTATYPAGYDVANVVSVAAIDSQQNLASFSNYGLTTVDIAAPGVGILSSVPGGGYASFSGTSMAAPHVAGALGLLLANEPGLSNAQAIQRLYNTGVALGTLQGLVRTARTLNAGRLMANDSVPVPPPAPPPAPCPYQVSRHNSAVDYSADNGQVLMDRVDEMNYRQVVLPFDFPFDGVLGRMVTVSPNGVLYFGSAPAGLDWQNGNRAPHRSLAALHTDLVSTVRVSTSANTATFYWRSSLYTSPGLGFAEVRVQLSNTGSIRQWVDFASPGLEREINRRVTVGVHGRSTQSLATFSVNDGKVKGGLGLEYTPLCGQGSAPSDGEVRIDRVNIFGFTKDQQRVRTLTPGQPVSIRVRPARNSGGGTVQAAIRLDGQLCAEAPQFAITPGSPTVLRGRLARALAGFRVRQLSVTVEGVEGRTRISSAAAAKRRKSLSQERFSTLCSLITRRLRVRG